MTKTWFITGASRGFGEAFTKAALARGDRVAATARNPKAVQDFSEDRDQFLPLTLDVTNNDEIAEAVKAAHDHFGVIDVVVNNAGHGLLGAVEELDQADLRAMMNVNFFGAVAVTQALLPILREQGHGHIVQVSSMGGLLALPLVGAYSASKGALEGLSEALAGEVKPLGIDVTLIEPGAYGTDFSDDSMAHSTDLDAYQPRRDAQAERRAGVTPGDPDAAAKGLLEIVDADEPPLRVIFGSRGIDLIKKTYQSRLDTWDQWANVTKTTDGQ